MFALLKTRRCALLAFAAATVLGSYYEARAAFNITTANSAITENFNAFAGTNATIPANFAFSANAVTSVNRGVYDSSGAFNVNNGLYALTHGPSTGANERAFGTKLQPGDTATVTWSFINQTGIPISQFNVSWVVEQYSFGNRPTAIDFNYNPNGTGFTQSGIAGTTLTTNTTLGGGSGQNLANPINTSRSISITLGTPLANGQPIDFRWSTTGGTGSGGNAHMGIDNSSVTAVHIPEPSAAWAWFGVFMTCGMATLTRVAGRRRFVMQMAALEV